MRLPNACDVRFNKLSAALAVGALVVPVDAVDGGVTTSPVPVVEVAGALGVEAVVVSTEPPAIPVEPPSAAAVAATATKTRSETAVRRIQEVTAL
jgi:hypothetical protein